MKLNRTYEITARDRAMAERIARHTGIEEGEILKSILISQEHVRIVRQRAILAGRLSSEGLPQVPMKRNYVAIAS